MPSMRDLIILCEAPRSRKPKFAPAPVADTNALHGRISSLIAILAGMDCTFSSKWAVEAIEDVKQKKLSADRMAAEEQERDPEGYNPADFTFDAKEAFGEASDAIVKKGSREFNILSDCMTAERLYQGRMVKDPDDWSDMVEDSAYLRCLGAQRELQGALLSFQVSQPSGYAPLLDRVDSILHAFKDFHGDESFRPEIVDSVRADLELLLPLMRTACKMPS